MLNGLVERFWPLAVFKPPVVLFWSEPTPLAMSGNTVCDFRRIDGFTKF
jgi:hypothetical protein